MKSTNITVVFMDYKNNPAFPERIVQSVSSVQEAKRMAAEHSSTIVNISVNGKTPRAFSTLKVMQSLMK